MKNHIKYLLFALLAPSLTGFSDVLVKWDTKGANGAQAENAAFMWTSAMTPGPIKRGPGFGTTPVTSFTPDTMAFGLLAGANAKADALSLGTYFEITLVPSVETMPVSIKSLSFSSKFGLSKSRPNTLLINRGGFEDDMLLHVKRKA